MSLIFQNQVRETLCFLLLDYEGLLVSKKMEQIFPLLFNVFLSEIENIVLNYLFKSRSDV